MVKSRKAIFFIDYAGSGVVHMLGGVAGFIGTKMIGPRLGIFAETEGTISTTGHSAPLQVLGTLILWFGWHGFNSGAVFAYDDGISDKEELVGRIVVNTVLAASTGCITAAVLSKVMFGQYAVDRICNGILSGLVSITAGCAVVDVGSAVFIGMVGSGLYFGASGLLKFYRIDDPLDASAVHGVSGFWGVMASALFSTQDHLRAAFPKATEEWLDNPFFKKLGIQLMGALTIIVWSASCTFTVFYVLSNTVGLRVDEKQEKAGLDTMLAPDGSNQWVIISRRVDTGATICIF
eukprot:UN33034